MKSLNNAVGLAAQAVVKSGINHVVYENNSEYGFQQANIFPGKTYLFLLKKRQGKVVIYDQKGKKQSEVSTVKQTKKTKAESKSKKDTPVSED